MLSITISNINSISDHTGTSYWTSDGLQKEARANKKKNLVKKTREIQSARAVAVVATVAAVASLLSKIQILVSQNIIIIL